jgi:DNA-binding NtrC family response regulator
MARATLYAAVSDLALAAVTTVPVLIVASDEPRRQAIAREIHDKGGQCAGAWVPMSGRGSTPTDLAAAFGRARGGTVFVDHLEELSESTQHELADLLNASARSGGAASLPRVIAGAAPGLWDAVVDGRFSEPLFYRINTIRFDVAALATGRSYESRKRSNLTWSEQRHARR